MIIVIADDLTGANDTGVQFTKHGLKTIVDIDYFNFSKKNFKKYDVISINTNSRILDTRTAYKRVYDIAQKCNKIEFDFIYKKIDSAMRGNPGAEIEGVMDAVGADIALVAPSYPENKRIVKNGYAYLSDNEEDLGESLFCLTDIIGNEISKKVEGIPIEIVRQGIEKLTSYIDSKRTKEGIVLLIDAISNDDLKTIVMVSKNMRGKVVLCGSAGLAQQLAENYSKKTAEKYKNEGAIKLLVVGTRNTCTAAQINNGLLLGSSSLIKIHTNLIISGDERSVIRDAVEKASTYITNGSKLITVIVSSIFENNFMESLKQSAEDIQHAQKIVKALGNIVKGIYERFDIKSIIATGGDTSMQICKSLEAEGIELIDEIAPGIPVGRIIGGNAGGLMIVTKSGGFGSDNIFTEVIDYLESIQ